MAAIAAYTGAISRKRWRRMRAASVSAAVVLGALLMGDVSMAKKERSFADIVSVRVSGSPGAYHFTVGIRSPDTGCERYADWWEVVSEEGRLLYRRILAHSHVHEQPFERSGGPVAISSTEQVWVRAHMHPDGYGGTVYKGSVRGGFRPAAPPPGLAGALERQPPLPGRCAY